jgi:hypothetical protein
LILVMFIVFLPSIILSAAIGGLSALVALPLPSTPGSDSLDWLNRLRQIPAWIWLILAVSGIILLVVTTAASWCLQAAAIRGAAMAADQRNPSITEMLDLGPQRFANIIKLSGLFGLLISLLAFLPPLILLLLPQNELVHALTNLAQVSLAPVNMVFGLAILLLMMAIALEDLQPKAAFGRAWQIFKAGWWGFLLVYVLTFLAGLVVIFLAIPLIFVVPFAFLSKVGWLIPLSCGTLLLPVVLFTLAFTSVFTLVMYTLTYREASRVITTKPA